MTRSQLTPMPEYFDKYINLVDDVEVKQALQISLQELEELPIDEWNAIGDRTYQAGKWTIKDILQHLLDGDRIFAYRALSFARGAKEVMPFDEELFGRTAKAFNRSLEDILQESILVRKATIALFNSFDDNMLNGIGMGFKGEYSVRAIGFIVAGHQRWHFNIIKDSYLNL